MQRRSATLEDVAREAGVSQQTVSRVLNNPDVVSERTRDKVIRAMQALRYVPNRSAQLLAGKSAPSIGLITASLTLHAPSQIAAAVKSYAGLHQLEVSIAMPVQIDYPSLRPGSMSFAPSISAARLSACRWKAVLRSGWWRRIPTLPACFLTFRRRPTFAACVSITATAAAPAYVISGTPGTASSACLPGRKVRFPRVCA